jgi:hypothetical protein
MNDFLLALIFVLWLATGGVGLLVGYASGLASACPMPGDELTVRPLRRVDRPALGWPAPDPDDPTFIPADCPYGSRPVEEPPLWPLDEFAGGGEPETPQAAKGSWIVPAIPIGPRPWAAIC